METLLYTGLVLALSLLALVLLLQARALRRLRAALRRGELGRLSLETVLDASGAAIWEWYVAERRIVLSERYYRQLGYEPGAFVAESRAWREQLHPDDRDRAIQAVRDYLAAPDGAYSNEYRMRDAQGRWRWILARGRVVRRGPEGQVLLMVGTHLDVDALKRQQAALLESRERFEKIYETTPDAMGISRIADGLYLDVNPAFSEMVGYSREETLGRSSLELGVWSIPAQRETLVQAFQRHGKVDSMEMQVRCKDGRLIDGLMSIRPLAVDGVPCMLFIYRDISDWQRLRLEAEQARAQSLAADAASRAKTEFLSRMSHELRTPLNAVLGFGQLLQGESSLGERSRRQVDAIVGAGWHLLQLINDVLDISRIEGGQLQIQQQSVGLAGWVREAVELVQRDADAAAVQLVIEVLPDWRVAGDPLRLRQCLVNLLSNAIKYNRRGGQVRVSAEPQGPGHVRLRVSDTGLGMTPKQLAHLFEPFNRLGREHEGIDGTGIGLVLTRHLLEAMGARLQIDSLAGQGTEACIELQRAQAEPQRPSERALELPAQAGLATVLYIEDKALNQAVVRDVLSSETDLRLLLAEDIASGLACLQRERPDLLLLDLHLPDGDGMALLRQLKADPQWVSLPIVVLSADAMPAEIEAAMAAGASAYWTKPLRLDRFVSELRALLARPR